VGCVVGDIFPIKIDGRSAGGFGVGGHLQLFVGGLRELGAKQGWGGEDEEQERKTAD
jgi:hypothetical protein